jgi:hypothetical protein
MGACSRYMIESSIMLTKSPQEQIRTNTASSWHMSGTAKMGRNAEDACVDSRFRVFGLDALRVVDMSVAPFVPRYVEVDANEYECVLIASTVATPNRQHMFSESLQARSCYRTMVLGAKRGRSCRNFSVSIHAFLAFQFRSLIAKGTAAIDASMMR